jgi:hypothetical protein
MKVLEYLSKKNCYASVTRLEGPPVVYKVELWFQDRFYFSKSFRNFEKAELYYWEKIKEEFL